MVKKKSKLKKSKSAAVLVSDSESAGANTLGKVEEPVISAGPSFPSETVGCTVCKCT